jgi:tetratricopeptide (TPR) repeat protein
MSRWCHGACCSACSRKPPPLNAAVLDVFSAGMRFTTAADLLRTLTTGRSFSTKDKQFRVTVEGGEAHLEFAYSHRSDVSFVTALSVRATEDLRKLLEDLLKPTVGTVSQRTGGTAEKVGRNDPCPCGSGRKFKRCCLLRTIPPTPRDLTFTETSNNEVVIALVAEARGNPAVLGDAGYWDELGVALASAGERDRAREAFEKALALDPAHPPAIMNLAAVLDSLGDLERALQLLDGLRSSEPRYYAIRGNVLQTLGRHQEAIECYELAIAGEPNFDLPYIRIQESLRAERSPLQEHWLRRAVEAVSDSAAVAVQYARFLYLAGRLDELEDAAWIDELTSRVGRLDLIGGGADEPAQIIEAQLWRACGIAMRTDSVERLRDAMALLRAHGAVSRFCEPAKALMVTAANLGCEELVEEAFGAFCERCRETEEGRTQYQYHLGVAYLKRDQWLSAMEHFGEVLRLRPAHLSALQGYSWALDKLGRVDEAIQAADQLAELDAEYPWVHFNRGYLCGRRGLLGRARELFKRQLQSTPGMPQALESLAILQVREGECDQAEATWAKWRAAVEERGERHENGEDDFSPERRHSKFAQLVAFARPRVGGKAYELEVKDFNEKVAPRLGIEAAISPKTYPLEEVLRLLAQDARDESQRVEVERYWKMQLRGDLSPLLAQLQRELPEWEWLPTEAKDALLEADRRLSDGRAHDFAPEVILYGKAVEIALKVKVFDSYKAKARLEPELARHVEAASQERFKQAHSFVRFIEKGQFLEFGAMVHALRLAGGRTGRTLYLLEKLNAFFTERLRLDERLSAEFLSRCDELTELRNRAAHATSCARDAAVRARRLAVEGLRVLSAAPLGNGVSPP